MFLSKGVLVDAAVKFLELPEVLMLIAIRQARLCTDHPLPFALDLSLPYLAKNIQERPS